ncbi:hypothetical protein [Streptomyces sp. NPDC057403]|uniref:hypothetical protein n=1 Tax=Streptomyces sp. NPDC057403 TaxID=3346119 RepID=UPI0036BD5E90
MTVTSIFPSGELIVLPCTEFDRLKQLTLGGPPMRSASGRLWAALGTRDTGRVRARWPSALVEAEALARATADLGSRRAAALDALALSRLVVTRHLGLTATEIIWYQAYTACLVGDTGVMLRHLERLPRTTYASRGRLLLRRWADVITDTSLRVRAVAQLRPLVGQDVETDALLVALAPREGTKAARIVIPYSELVGAALSDERFGTTARCITGLEADPPIAPHEASMPMLRALSAYLSARQSSALGLRRGATEGLTDLPPILVDDLIERNGLSPAIFKATSPEESPAWPPDRMSYLRCRLIPGEATTADLVATGFTAERARRAYLTQDREALDGLPDDDPAVRHYRALDDWRRTGRPAHADALRPEALRLLKELDALREALSARPGSPQPCPEIVAADPSSWWLLRSEVRAGSLRLPETTPPHTRFAEWFALWRVTGLIFDGRWLEGAAEGDALAARAVTTRARAEALNLAACARAEEGDFEGALARLDEAFVFHPCTALLVNAALVAAELESTATLPYLSRIAERAAGTEDASDTARENAVRAAIDHWQADKLREDFPAELTTLVRTALRRPVQDEKLYRLLLTISMVYDPVWLAEHESAVAASCGDHGALLRYYALRARWVTPQHAESLVDVLRLLVDMTRCDHGVAWVEEELRWMANFLDEGVHQEFGTAVHLVPAIEALLEGQVLDPVKRLVLSVQAAAHLTVHCADNNQDVSPAVERRLLFAPCAEFLTGSLDLPELVVEQLREELSRCVSVSAVRVLETAGQSVDDRAAEWARLMSSLPPMSVAAPATTVRRLSEILDDIGAWVARLRSYHGLLSALPEHETAREIAQMLVKAQLAWSAEVARLRPIVEGLAR